MLYHVQHQDVHEFSGMLCEMVRSLPVRLHVIDAVVAMEGNGPRSGDPLQMGVLLLSGDPVALDATFCRLIDLDPKIVPTNPAGARVGLGRYAEDEIEVVGEPLEACKHPGFKMIRRPVADNTSYAHYNWIKKMVLARPVIDAQACIRCGQCVAACPVPDKALRFDRGRKEPPVYHYERCIRCYCCHEMCPQRAIHTQRPLLGRIMGLA
jgi:Pyruvate/2-oxoacid:ferredoxin oxidoreductase delta subunit